MRFLLSLILLVGLAPVASAQGAGEGEKSLEEQFARAVFERLALRMGTCPDEVRQANADRVVVCVGYGSHFSAFKSDWEFLLDRREFDEKAHAVSPWRLEDGIYRRRYEVDGNEVEVQFDEEGRRLALAWTPSQIEDDAPDGGAPAGVGPDGLAEKPALAGFGGVSTPQILQEFYVEPDYPDGTAEDEDSGIVVLKVVVRADGTVAEAVPLRSRPEGRGFAEAAVAAVGRWRFEPATRDGEPVAAYFTLRLPFALSRPE